MTYEPAIIHTACPLCRTPVDCAEDMIPDCGQHGNAIVELFDRRMRELWPRPAPLAREPVTTCAFPLLESDWDALRADAGRMGIDTVYWLRIAVRRMLGIPEREGKL